MFVRSVTDTLEPCEAERLCEASSTGAEVDPAELSADGRAVYELLTASHREAAELALQRLSPSMRERLDVMSPLHYIDRVFAPMIIVGHDRDDPVIPVGESRRLVSAPRSPRRRDVHRVRDVPARRSDQRKLSPPRLVREVRRFYRSLYPMFRHSATAPSGPRRSSRERFRRLSSKAISRTSAQEDGRGGSPRTSARRAHRMHRRDDGP